MWNFKKGKKGTMGKPRNVGEDNPNAKLSEYQIRVIRQMAKAGYDLDIICRLFPVSESQIYNIVSWRAWKHVDRVERSNLGEEDV